MGINFTFNDQTQNYNYIGCNPTIITSKPKNIISISSGLYHSLALTDNGDVYQWGDYANGKFIDIHLSQNNSVNEVLTSFWWFKIKNISNVFITKFVCGPYHSLMLSNKGIVYCFGANDCGQCGVGSNDDKSEPTKVDSNLKFIDIGATKNYDISVGLGEMDFVMFGVNVANRRLISLQKPISIRLMMSSSSIQVHELRMSN